MCTHMRDLTSYCASVKCVSFILVRALIYKATRDLSSCLQGRRLCICLWGSAQLPLTRPSHAKPHQGKTQPGAAAEAPTRPRSQKQLLAVPELCSLALPSSDVPTSPAASPSPALLVFNYSESSEILCIVFNPPSALFLSHPPQPRKGGVCWTGDRPGFAGPGTDPAAPGPRPLSGSTALGAPGKRPLSRP